MCTRVFRALLLVCAVLIGVAIESGIAQAGAPSVFGTVSRFDVIPKRGVGAAPKAVRPKAKASNSVSRKAVRPVKKRVRKPVAKKRVAKKKRIKVARLTPNKVARKKVKRQSAVRVSKQRRSEDPDLQSRKVSRSKAALQAIIRRYARKENVPVKLAYAVAKIESNYRTHVTGPYGSVGLMQIKYTTAKGLGYRGSRKGLYHPEVNVKYAMKYLAGAFRRANGDICGTVWRYNAGYYAKRMNPISARYCRRTIQMMGTRYVSPKSVAARYKSDYEQKLETRRQLAAVEQAAARASVAAYEMRFAVARVHRSEPEKHRVRTVSVEHLGSRHARKRVDAIGRTIVAVRTGDEKVAVVMASLQEGGNCSPVPGSEDLPVWRRVASVFGEDGSVFHHPSVVSALLRSNSAYRRC